MLKGCQRRIIMVKDTGSRYFDSAYFVIKSNLPPSAHDSDMLSEAHRMIEAYSAQSGNDVQHLRTSALTPKRHTNAWWVFAGIMLSFVCVSAAVAAILFLA